jgi:hypothetical protein
VRFRRRRDRRQRLDRGRDAGVGDREEAMATPAFGGEDATVDQLGQVSASGRRRDAGSLSQLGRW